MEAYEALLTRRSIRVFTDQPVSEELVQSLLVAAMAAPSASNKQPWQFVVIADRTLLDRLAEIMPYGKMLFSAPLAVAVCGDMKIDNNSGYWVQDCSAATQNLLLAAHAQGLGAVWLGVHPRQERVAAVSQALGLPAEVIPLNLLAIGWPGEEKPPSRRFDPARIHRDHW